MRNEKVERLKEEADIESVVEHLGIQTHRKGAYTFVLCHIPSHNDKHPTNCYFKQGWHNLYCTTCSRSIRAVDLIMYETGCEYKDAIEQLWELEGRPSWFKENEAKGKKKTFHITVAELEFLGIHFPRSLYIPEQESAHKMSMEEPPSGYHYCDKAKGYLMEKKVFFPWQTFISEKDLKFMIATKIKEKRSDMKKLRQYADAAGVQIDMAADEKKLQELEAKIKK